jgi:hypothetical protein
MSFLVHAMLTGQGVRRRGLCFDLCFLNSFFIGNSSSHFLRLCRVFHFFAAADLSRVEDDPLFSRNDDLNHFGSKYSVVAAAMVVERCLTIIISITVTAVILRSVLNRQYMSYMDPICSEAKITVTAV